MLSAKALYVALNKMRISTYPQRLHWIVVASPTQGQFRWQASLVLQASKLTKPTLSLCYHIKLLTNVNQNPFQPDCGNTSMEMQFPWINYATFNILLVITAPEYIKSLIVTHSPDLHNKTKGEE